MGQENDPKESTAGILINIGKVKASFFINKSNNEACATINKKGIISHVYVNSKEFENFLRLCYYRETGKAPSKEAMSQALGMFESFAYDSEVRHDLKLRVKEVNGNFYYSLNNDNKEIIKVSDRLAKIIQTKKPYFTSNRNTAAQVKPDLDNGDIKLLLKYLNLKHAYQTVLLLVYIVTCMIASIPHAILIICGEKGAAKSTTSRMIKSIVDPSNSDILSMPSTLENLELILTSNYMPVFDNIDSINQAVSDIFCIASTGGSVIKRKLYTNSDMHIATFKQCLILNGISVVATKADILDRSLLIELERIKEQDLQDEKTLWKNFEKDKPAILGGIFNLLQKALNLYETVKLEKSFRMADFTKWGCAVSEAIGYGQEAFLNALEKNRLKLNDEALNENVIATVLIAFMNKKTSWAGSVTELFNELTNTAFQQGIDTHSKLWPKAANVLSRRLNDIKSNLRSMGIVFTIRHMNAAKMIEIKNKNAKDNLNEDFKELAV